MYIQFQSPQWGSNSKELIKCSSLMNFVFQSPQWGSNSKSIMLSMKKILDGFSPRNGEVILKWHHRKRRVLGESFSPRNGEVILKRRLKGQQSLLMYAFQSPQWGSNSKVTVVERQLSKRRFSPRNGEVILKGTLRIRITKPSKMQFPTISAHLEK